MFCGCSFAVVSGEVILTFFAIGVSGELLASVFVTKISRGVVNFSVILNIQLKQLAKAMIIKEMLGVGERGESRSLLHRSTSLG